MAVICGVNVMVGVKVETVVSVGTLITADAQEINVKAASQTIMSFLMFIDYLL